VPFLIINFTGDCCVSLSEVAAPGRFCRMTARVAGKKALVTGAAQGLGAASARMLAREGAQLVLTDRNPAGAMEVAAAINAQCGTGTASALCHDVTCEADWLGPRRFCRWQGKAGLARLNY
jgi:hypothetical protein